MQGTQKNQQNKSQDNLVENFSQSEEKARRSNHAYKSATEPEELKTPSPFVFQQSTAELKNEKKINELMLQNKRLRISNKELKKQLEEFEKRLDETLKKRTASEKKPRVAKQIVESMELKNAYKQCDIYKREIQKMKKKQEMFDQQKMQNLVNQVSQFQIQKQKFLQQIKGLKKLSKQQEKALLQLTGTNYLKVFKQLEELKEENKKLSQRLSREDRQTKISKIAATNERRKMKESEVKNNQQKKKEDEKQSSQIQILKAKAEKDSKKIAFLTSENNKLNAVCEDHQRIIEQKDKQIAAIRLRLGVLRKQTRVKNSRLETQPSKVEKNQAGHATKRRADEKHNKQKSNLSLTQGEQPKENKKVGGKYPRLAEAGDKKQSSFKWNHHQFSSKIKQVQLTLHPNGQVNEVNFRYEKGEPNQTASKGNWLKFTCEENTGEYIRSVKGGFKDGLLRYLVLETNKGRNSKFGQHQLEPQCSNFTFGEGESEYPGAFFGQNSADGINRLGCLVECIK